MNKEIWNPVYVGIGSNMNRPKEQVLEAVEALRALSRTVLCKVSRLVTSPPVGYEAQNDFVNAVAAVLTQLAPLELLDHLQQIENNQGRVRSGAQWGPRVIDLDILLFAEQVIDSPRLTVPHPFISERHFVLGPLMEIAPYLKIPGVGQIDVLARNCDLAVLTQMDVHVKAGGNAG